MDLKKYQAVLDNPSRFSVKEQTDLQEEFRIKALIETGLWGHPRANELFALAWDNGYDGGFEEVLEHLDDLANMALAGTLNS